MNTPDGLPPSDNPIDYYSPRCWYDECHRLAAFPGKSGRLTSIGRLDPPFLVHEQDGTVSEETYCICIRNETGLRRLLLNGQADADALNNLLGIMVDDEAGRARAT